MVTERYITLLQSFRILNEQIDLCSLNSRIAFQKKVYFLQEFGCDLHYHFGWYLKGPYSPDLTRDAYEVKGLETELAKVDFGKISPLVGKSTEILGKFLQNIRTLVNSEKGEDYWLELAASLHFLKTKLGVQEKIKAFDRLDKAKPSKFTQPDMELIWPKLETVN